MKKIICVLLVSLMGIINCATMTGVVKEVLDGDTVKFWDNEGGKFKIRLADIDAPQKNQLYGMESKQALSDKILNRIVTIKFTTIDHYGRIVGTIYLNNRQINKEMIEEGHAWHYYAYSKRNELKFIQTKAREAKKGMWKFDNNQAPWEFRKLNKKSKKTSVLYI